MLAWWRRLRQWWIFRQLAQPYRHVEHVRAWGQLEFTAIQPLALPAIKSLKAQKVPPPVEKVRRFGR